MFVYCLNSHFFLLFVGLFLQVRMHLGATTMCDPVSHRRFAALLAGVSTPNLSLGARINAGVLSADTLGVRHLLSLSAFGLLLTSRQTAAYAVARFDRVTLGAEARDTATGAAVNLKACLHHPPSARAW
jgi:hypothetical protein